MKNQVFLLLCLLIAGLVVPSCKNDSPAPANPATTETLTTEALTLPTVTETPATADPAAAATTAATPIEPPQNASGVWHYTCPKGCKKGGGAAAPCATCGTTLTHNTAYHGGAKPAGEAVPNPAASAGTAPTPTPTPEPAQNKAGVWHYTCADGCAGGAGTASPCAKCSKTLVHNTTYHQ
jgi:hypothetical protein